MLYAHPVAPLAPLAALAVNTGMPRMALLRSVRVNAGRADAITASLDAQLALALSSEGQVDLCCAERVRELLRDVRPEDPLAQLRHLWSHLGSVTVLSVELIGTAPRWSGRALLFGPDGSIHRGRESHGADAAGLARSLVNSVQQFLPSCAHLQAPLDLPDAFTAEAYLRASGAADEWRWHRARRLALVVCDQAPESLGARMLLLRTLLHTHPKAAVEVGERLLKHIGHRVAPEYLASVLVALGQSLSVHADAESHRRALVHLQSAVDLAQGKPATVWAIRAHLALAAKKMLGDARSREQAALLLEQAATIADQCGNALLASAARSNLGYLLHHDGHIERSLRLHEAALQQALDRQLDGPVTFAQSIKGELIRAWGQLAAAQGCLDLAWHRLERVAPDDRAQPGAYLAYVQTGTVAGAWLRGEPAAGTRARAASSGLQTAAPRASGRRARPRGLCRESLDRLPGPARPCRRRCGCARVAADGLPAVRRVGSTGDGDERPPGRRAGCRQARGVGRQPAARGYARRGHTRPRLDGRAGRRSVPRDTCAGPPDGQRARVAPRLSGASGRCLDRASSGRGPSKPADFCSHPPIGPSSPLPDNSRPWPSAWRRVARSMRGPAWPVPGSCGKATGRATGPRRRRWCPISATARPRTCCLACWSSRATACRSRPTAPPEHRPGRRGLPHDTQRHEGADAGVIDRGQGPSAACRIAHRPGAHPLDHGVPVSRCVNEMSRFAAPRRAGRGQTRFGANGVRSEEEV